jgi:outer membrane protein
MRSFVNLFFLVCVCFGVGRLGAQPVSAVQDTVTLGSLSAAVSMALQHNPTQAVYLKQVRQGKYNYKASVGNLLPNASAGFAGTDNLYLAVTPLPGNLFGQPGKTIYAQFGKKYVYNTGLTVSESLFNWQTILATRIATNNLRLTESQLAGYEQSLREQVARTYFSVLIARVSLGILQSDSAAGDSLVTLSKQRLQQGMTDAISVNQAIINLNSILQNKAQSRQLYDQGLENLKILLGTKPATELVFREVFQPEALIQPGPVQLGPDRSLDTWRRQIDIAELQRQSQKAAAYPSLTASAYLGYQQYRDNFGVSFGDGAWPASRNIGLSLTVPLFTGLNNTYKYKAAVIQKTIAQMQWQSATDQSQINDRLLFKNHGDYLIMVRASADNFGLYAANLRLDKQKYEEGVITMDVYQRAFQDYLTAENTYMNNLSQLLSVKATILSRQ